MIVMQWNLEMHGSGFMITNRVVRALLQAGMIEVNKEGRYLLDVNLASVDWPLRRKEAASHVAGWLKHRFDIEAGRYSVWGKDDYDAIPSYETPLKDQHPFIIIQ